MPRRDSRNLINWHCVEIYTILLLAYSGCLFSSPIGDIYMSVHGYYLCRCLLWCRTIQIECEADGDCSCIFVFQSSIFLFLLLCLFFFQPFLVVLSVLKVFLEVLYIASPRVLLPLPESAHNFVQSVGYFRITSDFTYSVVKVSLLIGDRLKSSGFTKDLRDGTTKTLELESIAYYLPALFLGLEEAADKFFNIHKNEEMPVRFSK